MKIYRGKIKPIAEDVITKLVKEGDIEVAPEQIGETVLDVEAIIREYLRMDEEISRQAREIMQKKGTSYTEFGRIRRMLAEEKNFELGDRVIYWISNQIVECFMINSRVSEIFSEDHAIRRKIAAVFDAHLGIEKEVERETRERIKNLEEGTPEWELEYRRVYNQIARRKGLL